MNQFQQFSAPLSIPNVPIQWDVAPKSAEFPDFGSVEFSSPIDEGWILNTAHAINSINFASITPTTIFHSTTPHLSGLNASVSDYKVSGRLVISIRLVSGKVTHVETEGFYPGKATPL
jgi:hypothetical protein